MVARTREMSKAEVRARQQHAHSFLGAAKLVKEFGPGDDIVDVANTVGSLAVLAGIAAADAISGAALGHRSASQSHGDAVALLKSINGGAKLAPHLARLVDSKTEAQYAPALLTAGRADALLTSAQRLVDGMDAFIRALPSP